MKKILFTATMLACFSAFSNAQQGRVGINTTSPSATLDIVATTTDNTRPDALLVPRMTAAELLNKDNTSGTYAAAQNGAIVYITSGTGNTARTTKITGAGFYYFDNTVPEWKPFGGGTTVSSALNVTSQTSNYTALPTDDIILFTTSGPTTLTLPTTGVTIGKRLYVSVIGNTDVSLSPAVRETANVNLITGQGNILMYTGGTGNGSWSIISGY